MEREKSELINKINNLIRKSAELLPDYVSHEEFVGDMVIKHDEVEFRRNEIFLTQKDIIDLCNGKNSLDQYIYNGVHKDGELEQIYYNRVIKSIKAEIELLIVLKRKLRMADKK